MSVVMEQLIGQDPMKRGIRRLTDITKGQLDKAAASLSLLQNVKIITGFYIPKADGGGTAETDGPPGAAILGGVLRNLGKKVGFATDHRCAKVVVKAVEGTGFNEDQVECITQGLIPDVITAWIAEGVDCVISIERVSPSIEGPMRNMRGESLQEHAVDFSGFFKRKPWLTIGVGDGGNEIGMGNIPWPIIEADVKFGGRIAAAVKTDHLIVAGVSNWGAYGLAASLAGPVAKFDYLYPKVEERIVQAIVAEAGACDGTTLKREATVDGLPLAYSTGILGQIRHQMMVEKIPTTRA